MVHEKKVPSEEGILEKLSFFIDTVPGFQSFRMPKSFISHRDMKGIWS